MLRELAKLFPDLAAAIEARLTNVRDLMLPFKRRDVYRWPMRALTIRGAAGAGARDVLCRMEIADGMAAMQAYRERCVSWSQGGVGAVAGGDVGVLPVGYWRW
ncbi:MAG: hypothetical protein R2864_07860 [Syntrophotaleaceae bacterium]